MTDAERMAIDLTDEECELMVLALNEFGGTAQHTYRLLCPVLGQSNQHEWFRLINRLDSVIENKEPLSDLDWARAMFLTDICFGSTLVGSGLRFGRAPMNTGSRYCARFKKKSALASAFFCL